MKSEAKKKKKAAKGPKAAKAKIKKEAKKPPPKKPSNKIDKYELRFGSLEVVLAAGDLESTDVKKKFLVGRLQEDILFGCDNEADVAIDWFDEEANIFYKSDLDYLPAGSLVCSITKYCKEGFADGRDTLEISDDAWEYGERKLQQQLSDGYKSDEDSQFGDEVVTKRLKRIPKGAVIDLRDDDSGYSDNDDVNDDDGGGGEDEENEGGAKKKRKTSKKAPKTTKKKFKRGLTPRPDFAIVDNPFEQATGKIDDFAGDVERATKEVFRAVQSRDLKALKAAAKSSKVSSLHSYRSVGLSVTPLMYAMVDSNVDAVKILLDDLKSPNVMQDKRASMQKCALPTLSTGRISGRHANYNRRQVGASRGGREGNNALLHDVSGDYYASPHGMADNALPCDLHVYKDEMIPLSLVRDFDAVPDEILDLAEATYSRTFRSSIENIVRGGQRKLAKRFIDQALNMPYTSNSYNFLHLEALADAVADPKKPFSKDFQARSVAKLSSTDTRFSPLACACINPESGFLEALLTVAPEHAHLCDSKETSLVHYAAACEGSDPLTYLLEKHSLSKTGIDKRKETPMHYAARAARYKNVLALLKDSDAEQVKTMLTAKTAEGFIALHYAVISQRQDGLETVRTLLKNGSNPNLASTAGRNKVSSMHLAARVGSLETLKALVDYGGNPSKGDKLGRSPLVHACQNGHAHVVSYLLAIGVDHNVADSSDNYPVHYAAAYGWDDCLQLLLDAGADPDAKNSWKTSPLSAAIQKGRHRVTSLLLKLPAVDVNFKNDEGKSLFFRLVEAFISEKMLGTAGTSNSLSSDKKGKRKAKSSDTEEIAAIQKEMPWALKKLLERGDVDLATTDTSGNNVLHLLCSQKFPVGGNGEKRAVALSKLILSRSKLDLNAAGGDMPPILHAATEGNALLLEFLVNRGASVGPSTVAKDGRNLCHFLLLSAEGRKMIKLVEKMAGEAVLSAMLESPDGLGFTPVHTAMRALVGMVQIDKTHTLQSTLMSLVGRFPNLATKPVSPIRFLKEPERLADLVLIEAESDGDDDDSGGYRFDREERTSASTLTVLGEKERLDPAKVRKALDSHDRAVLSSSDSLGKSLIHFVCDCRAPSRMKQLLEWIVPLSKKVINDPGGVDNEIYSPLQQLLYKVLPASDLCLLDSSGDAVKDRLQCLNLVIESIALLLDNGAKDVNSVRQGAFATPADRLRHKDGAKVELTAEQDAQNVRALKRCARAVKNGDPKAKGEIVKLFEDLMGKRKLRALAANLGDADLPSPVAHNLAGSRNAIPTSIWEALVERCGLDLAVSDVYGRSVLHVALAKEDAELSEYLCKQSPALMTTASNEGECPVHVVAKLDNSKFVKLLLKNIAEKEREVNRTDSTGRTAFHFSVEKAAKRVGEALDPCEIIFLRAGARLDIADNVNQRTPLHYCFFEQDSKFDNQNIPTDVPTHDRVDLVSSLLAASGAEESVKMADKFGRTPLFYAAAYNSTVSSLLLVSKGADLFKRDDDGNTPINVAVLCGHENYAIAMLKSVGSQALPDLVDVVVIKREVKLLESGEKQIVIVEKNVRSIVWHAIKQNLRGLVYILLDTSFPLHQATIDALTHGSFQLARKLLTTSPPEVVRHVDQASGRNLLHEVAQVKRYQNSEWSTTLAEILLSFGVLTTSTAKDGQSTLHMAAGNSHLDLVRLFMQKDANAALILDNEGHLPLGRFMRSLPQTRLNEKDCIEMIRLLSKSSSLSDDKWTRVPRLKKEERVIDDTGFEFKAGPNKESVSAELQKRRGAGKNENDLSDYVDGYSTLLIQALNGRKYTVLQELVDSGADVDGLDSKGLAPLHHAVLSMCLKGATLLLRNGANPDVASGDERRVTPLIVASFRCGEDKESVEMAKLLIRSGADVSRACKISGGTALHFACRENNYDFARLVLRGALHSTTSVMKGELAQGKGESGLVLVRLGHDCALHPAKFEGTGVRLLLHKDECFVPMSRVTGITECHGLYLDSLAALVALRLGKDKEAPDGKSCVQSEGDQHGSSDEAMDDDDDSNEEMDEEDDSDEEMDDDSAMSEPDTSGHEGGIVDASAAAAKKELSQYYGLESALVGSGDAMLTKPLELDSYVLFQNAKPREYASLRNVWMRGRICAVHKNGTYDVDVFRGLIVEGVVRQLLRPWKSGEGFSWPQQVQSSSAVRVLLAAKDKRGYTPLMTSIKPVAFGSYEQCKFVDLLTKHGAEIDAQSLLLARANSDFRKHCLRLASSDGPKEAVVDGTIENQDMQEAVASLYGLEPISSDAFDEELGKALVEMEARGSMKRKHEPRPVNPVCELKAAGRRVLPAESPGDNSPSLYFDVVMTKVELSHYGHSENKYYKMQIVEDPNKGLFVLLNNWGQIGDYGGQKQETPFGSRDEATADFMKVFKQKTGNTWGDFVSDKFQPKLGKYKPVTIVGKGYEKPRLPDLVEMMHNTEDYEQVVRDSKLPADLMESMTAFVDPGAINSAAGQLGLQQEKLPLGCLSIETLLAAEKKLEEVESALHLVSQKTKPEELKEKREALDQVAILSSEFYELLPTKEGDESLSPLDQDGLKEQRGHILSLKNLTVAAQIVNTACIKATESNPLDFAYRCMRASIGVLPKETPERTGVEQYFRNTIEDEDLVISQVYELHRHDEVSNKDKANHRLLWHGTNRANVMGVIKEGLRVAPPTAMISGNAFGDGVYFADMAAKSFPYTRETFSSDAKEMPKAYLFLADVALGKQACFSETSWSEKPVDDSVDSVWAVGYEGPDIDRDVVLSRSGAVIPLGKVVKSPTFKRKGEWKMDYWSHMDDSINEAAEAALSSRDTIYPARIRTEYNSYPADIVLEHGPYAKTAKIVPLKIRKVKTESLNGSKKRKDNDGNASAVGNDDEDNEIEFEPTFNEFTIERNEVNLNGHVHYSEFIVKDPGRINLRYLVEVTSRSWLESKAKKTGKLS